MPQLKYWDGSSWQNAVVGAQGTTGNAGIQGFTGIQGLTGSQGTTGLQGLTGTQGLTGAQGVNGSNGANGAQGTQGLTGTQGVQGTFGLQGTQGLTGTAPTGIPVISSSSTSYTVTSADKGDFLRMTASTATNVFLPDFFAGFNLGDTIDIIQAGTGQLTIQTTGNAFINSTAATPSTPKTRTRYSAVTCVLAEQGFEGEAGWYVIGDIV